MNENLLNIKIALEMVDNEKSLLTELLEAFREDVPFSLKKLNNLMQATQEDAAKYVHYYKGAARQIGAEALAQSGQNLEDVLRGKKSGDIAQLADIFSNLYFATQEAVSDSLLIL